MASPKPPSTPKVSTIPDFSTSSPGKWRHPRLKEIVRRQNASQFGDANIQGVLWNGGLLILSGFLGKAFKNYSLELGSSPKFPDAVLLIVRSLLLLNILVAMYPLYKPKDEIADIPLTPSQRALLGLDPNSTPPATPGTQYITPPRYRLSSGPRRTSTTSPNGSPFSSRYDSSDRRPSDTSSFSPSASPLFYKAFPNGARDSGRRHSFGSPSPLGRSSLSINDGSVFRSPSPNGSYGRGSGQILTNKWLYERNRMNF